jgi:hypothetical protein
MTLPHVNKTPHFKATIDEHNVNGLCITTNVKSLSETVWTASIREEFCSAIWFLVAFVADIAGCHPWVFWTFIVKAIFDFIFSIIIAIRDMKEEEKLLEKSRRTEPET